MYLNTPLTHLYTTKKTVVMKHHQTILFLDPKMAHMSSPHSIFTFICRYIYTQQKLYEYIYMYIYMFGIFTVIYIYVSYENMYICICHYICLCILT